MGQDCLIDHRTNCPSLNPAAPAETLRRLKSPAALFAAPRFNMFVDGYAVAAPLLAVMVLSFVSAWGARTIQGSCAGKIKA